MKMRADGGGWPVACGWWLVEKMGLICGYAWARRLAKMISRSIRTPAGRKVAKEKHAPYGLPLIERSQRRGVLGENKVAKKRERLLLLVCSQGSLLFATNARMN